MESIIPEDQTSKFRIIIDPGHGGQDLGARSSKHILEKNVNLKLARLIIKNLSKDMRIETMSARPDDSEASALSRIKFANSRRGEMYISLHTDGGMGPRAHSIKIFICKYLKDEKPSDAWEKQNYEFQKENGKLARAIADRLEELQTGRTVDIFKSGDLLLGGLAMPAVIVEAVDLSNPEDEINLEKEIYITKIAGAISMAVKDYLNNEKKL